MNEQREVVILSGVRTAIGDYGGSLKDIAPTELACVLSGGAARALSPRLNIPFELHENLVLEGLYRISQTIATT